MLSHLLYFQNGIHGNLCAISLTSLEYVRACPSNIVEMENSSKRKNCSQYIHEDAEVNCADYKKIIYHCVLNEYGNQTIEVCAPEMIMHGKLTRT